MKKALEEVEYKMYKESMEPIIPEEWRDDYEGYLLNPKDGYSTIEGRIIGVADNIDALNEAIQEVKLGNKTFIPKLQEIANCILDIDLDSGKYFIKHSLQEFELPMEMYGERVIKFINQIIKSLRINSKAFVLFCIKFKRISLYSHLQIPKLLASCNAFHCNLHS